jgi:hypothetical protein
VVTVAVPLLPVEGELDDWVAGVGVAVAVADAALVELELSVPVIDGEVFRAVAEAALPAYDAAATYPMPQTAIVAPAAAPKVNRRRRCSARSRSEGVIDFIWPWCTPVPCSSVMLP